MQPLQTAVLAAARYRTLGRRQWLVAVAAAMPVACDYFFFTKLCFTKDEAPDILAELDDGGEREACR